MFLPLQFGLPGVAELFIILLILFVIGLPLLAVLAVVVYLFTRDGEKADDTATAKDERIEELEREVADLRDQVGEQPADTASDTAGDTEAADDDRA